MPFHGAIGKGQERRIDREPWPEGAHKFEADEQYRSAAGGGA
jgi:hypothetical protein